MDIQERIENKLKTFCVDNGINRPSIINQLRIAANLGASAVYETQAEEGEAIIRQEKCRT